MIRKFLFVFLFILLTFLAYSEGRVIVVDDIEIVLFDDGTWKYKQDVSGDLNLFIKEEKDPKNENKNVSEILNIDDVKEKSLIKELKTKDNWDFFIFSLKNETNDFTKLIFQTIDNEITITNVEVSYYDGTEKKIPENFTLYPDKPSKLLPINKLGEAGEIKNIEIDFDTVREVSPITHLKIYGLK
jgi:hypothetical protein